MRKVNRNSTIKSLLVSFQTAVYAYRMAVQNKTFENIVGLEDELTGLPNRRALYQYAEKLTDYSLIIIDCDGFKDINDNYGHDEGDRILQEIGKTLSTQPVFAARLGGDEFVLIVENTQLVVQIVEAVRRQVRDRLGITISQGVCMTYGTLSERLKIADLALYESKAKGKNAISYMNISMENIRKKEQYNLQYAQEAVMSDEANQKLYPVVMA